MNYTPGTAVFGKKVAKESIKNRYVIKITCDANDADYMKDEVIWAEKDMKEVDILAISYLNLKYFSIPKNWKDVQDAKDDWGFIIGGFQVMDNPRFPTVDEDGCNWLYRYCNDRELLLFCGAIDDECYSIEELQVYYYDENGERYACEMVDLGALFESEKEFIEYLTSLEKFDEDEDDFDEEWEDEDEFNDDDD